MFANISGPAMAHPGKLIWALFLIAGSNALMHENVFFNEIRKFSMSRLNWLISFVVDLSTYERFLDKLTADINRTTVLTQHLLSSRKKPNTIQPHFYNDVLGGFQSEMAVIRGMHEDIIDSFSDYKFLKDSSVGGRSRKK